MNITNRVESIITNALRVAAQDFQDDAQEMRKDAKSDTDGRLRLAAQFDLQAREAREVLEDIETHGMTKCFVVVYQPGIANLFEVDSFEPLTIPGTGRHRERKCQADYKTVECIALGLVYAGARVRYASCNRTGDVASATWTHGLGDCPFRFQARPRSTAAIEIE
jgi:hypothetical protein